MRALAARLAPFGTAFALTAVAGAVDAVAYTRIAGVFPANQSGNLILLGVTAGGFPGAPAWRTAGAIAAFVVGVLSATRIGGRLGPRRRPLLLTTELALLVAAAGLAGSLPLAETPATVDGARGAGALVLLGLAMGVQTEVTRRVLGVRLSTTFESGALTRIAEAAGRPASGDRTGATVLALLVVLYVAGAAAGASVAAHWTRSLLAPVLAVATLIVVETAKARSVPG